MVLKHLLALGQPEPSGVAAPSATHSIAAQSAALVLADGSVFMGESIGAPGLTTGELVFNTSLTGYQEILTDPSYRRQVVTLTYPHIGNTGFNPEDYESAAIQAAGLVIRDLPVVHSNFRAQHSLTDALQKAGVVAISGVDTREITRRLRDQGAQGCAIIAAEPGQAPDLDSAKVAAAAFQGLVGAELASEVTCAAPYAFTEGTWVLGEGYTKASVTPAELARPTPHVVAYDLGVKRNILRLLVAAGCRVTVVPASMPYDAARALSPDGIFLSNGPGDPEPCANAIDVAKRALADRLPTFGICLGHQILALAAGAKTFKMKFGHHGANHPVKDLETGRVAITSQNHGFAVAADSLPGTLRVTHRSLFDQSIQGLAHTEAPAFSFQGHPEASPGPHDLLPLFDQFVRSMRSFNA